VTVALAVAGVAQFALISAFLGKLAIESRKDPSKVVVSTRPENLVDPSLDTDFLRRWALGRVAVAYRDYRGEIDDPRPETLDMAANDASALAFLAAYLKDPLNDDSMLNVAAGIETRGDGHKGEARRRLYELALRINELALPRSKRMQAQVVEEAIARIQLKQKR
jgi:hypothetical protein